MPITKSAKKALRVDRRRTLVNLKVKNKMKAAVASFKKRPTQKALGVVASALDRAAKKNIIKKNKASRLKSKLAAYLKRKPKVKKTTKKSKDPKK